MIDLVADPQAVAASKLGPGAWAAARSDGVLLRRWFGCWIDFLAMAALFFAVALPLDTVNGMLGAIVSLSVVLAYFPVTEGLWGRSLGKLLSGTIVVDAQGNLPGVGRAIVRTVTRLVEVNPFLFGGLPAGLIVVFTKRHQRLGDILAGTYVVPVKDLAYARRRSDTDLPKVFD